MFRKFVTFLCKRGKFISPKHILFPIIFNHREKDNYRMPSNNISFICVFIFGERDTHREVVLVYRDANL